MKKLSLLLSILIIWSCARKGENNPVSDTKRIEITPFKINKILLRDTQLIKTVFALADSGRMTINEYQENWDKDYKFLDYTSFNALRNAVWALINNPGSRVYVNSFSKSVSSQELKDRILMCDSLAQSSFDAQGNEIITAVYMCDSTSTIRHINQIRFFETWYFNPANNMIERDMLGYSVHEFVPDKNAFRELFDVFVSDEALEKAKKYYFNKLAQ